MTHLPQDGRLARHVWTGQQHDARCVVEVDVVGDELSRRKCALHYGVPAALQREGHLVGHRGTRIFVSCGRIRKALQHVEWSEVIRRILNPMQSLTDRVPQAVQNLPLSNQCLLLCAQHSSFVFLEFGGDEPFGAGEGLAPVVILRHRIAVRLGDLDVVAEHAVEPDLE